MAKKKEVPVLKTAEVLAFERKLDPSDAVFASGKWDDRHLPNAWVSLPIREKSVRGTISNRLSAKGMDAAKLDASIEKPNLQTVDVATLPMDADTLRVSFTLRVLGGAGTPSACNNPEYRRQLLSLIEEYKKEHGFSAIASRYALNIANGRFLWRNRLGAESIEITVAHLHDGGIAREWKFDAYKTSLQSFDAPQGAEIKELSALIAAGLAGGQQVLLQVNAFARIGQGQEVYPSQELILDKGDRGKSKTLYSVQGVAGMHSQKIGNALRTIDTWHGDAEVDAPIAVEPYGSVTSHGHAYRPPIKGTDFYTLLDGWVLKDETPDVEQQHYVMAMFVRGGVFGASGKE